MSATAVVLVLSIYYPILLTGAWQSRL